MKRVKAYAVVTTRGKIVLWNSQLPIFWRKSIALEQAYKWARSSKVVTVWIDVEDISEITSVNSLTKENI